MPFRRIALLFAVVGPTYARRLRGTPPAPFTSAEATSHSQAKRIVVPETVRKLATELLKQESLSKFLENFENNGYLETPTQVDYQWGKMYKGIMKAAEVFGKSSDIGKQAEARVLEKFVRVANKLHDEACDAAEMVTLTELQKAIHGLPEYGNKSTKEALKQRLEAAIDDLYSSDEGKWIENFLPMTTEEALETAGDMAQKEWEEGPWWAKFETTTKDMLAEVMLDLKFQINNRLPKQYDINALENAWQKASMEGRLNEDEVEALRKLDARDATA
jgi:hypothetical protein